VVSDYCGLYFFFGNKASILLINDSILYHFFLDICAFFLYFAGTLCTFFFPFAEPDMSRNKSTLAQLHLGQK